MPSAFLFHAGALGDWVLTWPLVRALGRNGWRTALVQAGQKARLAASVLGASGATTEPVEAEQPRFAALWRGPGAIEAGWIRPDVSLVLAFNADGATDAGRHWLAAAERMFPSARVTAVGPPGSPSRALAWAEFGVHRLGDAAPAPPAGPERPIVLHVGAGSPAKRWSLERFGELALSLRGDGATVEPIAGEAELERFSPAERALFDQIGGRYLATLDELARCLAGARAVAAGDSGPAHLAAQLGLPTVAFFGPTDPSIWAPVGPLARAVAPPDPRPMTWLDVPTALAAVRAAAAARA
ncbi:MAG: glycosyltransferase family 9 protein [Phycisphaerae bacterium]|nr:glycosyltransferase family 9 protein [Phycisphaerae bacterium]